MGIGTALGAAVDGYRAGREDNLRDRQFDQRQQRLDREEDRAESMDKYRAKQMEVMDYNLKSSKRDYAESHTPAANQARAKMLQLKNMALSQAMQPAQSPGTSTEVNQVNQRLAKVEETQKDTVAQTKTVNVIGNIMDTIGRGQPLTDLKPFNDLVAETPALQTVYKNPVIFYNPNDASHVAGLRGAAQKSLKLHIDTSKMEPEAIDLALKAQADYIEGLARVGKMVVDSKTGEMYPIDSAINMLGVSKHVSQGVVSDYNKQSQVINEKTSKNIMTQMKLPEVPEWQQDGGSKSKIVTDYKGLNPENYAYGLKLSGIPIPDDLKAIVDSNSKLRLGDKETDSFWTGASPEQVKERMDVQRGALIAGIDDPTIAARTLSRYESGIDLLKDSDERKQARKVVQSAKDVQTVDKIFDSPAPPPGSESTMISIEDRYADNAAVKDVSKKFKAKGALVDGINSLQTDIVSVVENGEGYVKGVAASPMLMQAMGIAPDAASKALKMLGQPGATKEQIMNTVGLNSKLGKLIAAYVKDTSGSAVSDKERTFLTNVLAGAQGGDPQIMLRALSTFRDTTASEMQAALDDKRLRSKLPYTMYKRKDISNQYDYEAAMSSALKGKEQKKKVVQTDLEGDEVPDAPPPGW